MLFMAGRDLFTQPPSNRRVALDQRAHTVANQT